MPTTYSLTKDAHYCACGGSCEWIDDPRYEGLYGLRCDACAATYWDTDDAPELRTCSECGRSEPAHEAPDQDGEGRSVCCAVSAGR